MTLNELIKWADENGMDFDVPIQVGDSIQGSWDLDPKMIDLEYQDKTKPFIYIESDGDYSR